MTAETKVPEMVERVAKAIDDTIRIDHGFDVLNLEEVARAAIEAMREPTEAMYKSAGEEDVSVYFAMIETALSESPE